ncbi:MAG: fibronectin type III domain-containing protein [Ralstonia sp.]
MSPVYFRPERPEPGDGVTAAPAWIPVKNHRVLEKGSSGEGLAGRYLQWKAELLGTGREATPVLYDLTITLEPDPPPGPPILLDAEPADGGVVLTWVTAREGDIAGYRVHYGSASGAYFGPNSPMYIEKRSDTGDTRRVRIDGLTNEQVYYFRVTAVDAEGQESVFSRELVARPSGIYGR